MKTKLLAPGILVIATILAFTGVAHASASNHHQNRHAENNHPVLSQRAPDSPPSPPSQGEPTPPEKPVEQPVAAPEPQPVGNVSSENVTTRPVEASAAASVDVSTEVKLK